MSATKNRATNFPSANKKTILCIDDHLDGLTVRKLFLETFGYRVLLASSGREGLAVLEGNPVDAVLLDYRMPEMDGEAVALEVRSKWPGMPIIMLSGYVAEIPDRVHKLVNAFVSKGSPPNELLQVLEKALGSVPKKPPLSISTYDLLERKNREQIARSRSVIAQNRAHLRAEKNRQG